MCIMIIARKTVINKHFNCFILLNKFTLSCKQQLCHSTKWSVLFFGTDKFALASLRQVHNQLSNGFLSKLEVVTSYKGAKDNDLIIYTKKHNIKLHSWPITFPIAQFDIGLVVSFGHLIPTWIIKSFPLGMINVHASLLPRWRGAAPIIHSLINGDEKTGVSIIKIMPDKFDIGKILAQTSINIHPDETQPELHDKLANIGGELLSRTIEQLPDIIHAGSPQSDKNITYASKITKDLSVVHWNKMSAANVYNLHRALVGIYPLTTYLNDEKVKLYDIKCHEKKVDSSKIIPGLVLYDKKNNFLTIQCQDGVWVSVKQLSLYKRRKMTATEFYNGFMADQIKQQIVFTDKNNTN